MKKLLTLLFILIAFASSRAQLKGATCLNTKSPFELFNRQIKLNAKPIHVSNLENLIADSIYLEVQFDNNISYDYLIKGVKVLIVNTTNRDLEFLDEGTIELICQANDTSGEWYDIEGRPTLWNCWATYKTLPEKSYYEAVAPCYDGGEEYKLRYRFTVDDQTYYSNEFMGRINSSQLISKKKP